MQAEALLHRAKDMRPEPTWTIYSGRGIWLFWQLAEPAPVDGKNGEKTLAVEERGIGLEEQFGTSSIDADNCRNIERIARLPGTINFKTGQLVRVLAVDVDKRVSLEDLPRVARNKRRGTKERGEVPEKVGRVDLNTIEIPSETKALILEPNFEGYEKSRSERQHHVTCELIREDVSDADIVSILLHYPIGEHLRKKPEETWRTEAIRQLENALEVQSRPGPILSKQNHYGRAELWRDSNRPNIKYWRGDFYDHERGGYVTVHLDDVKAEVGRWLHSCRTKSKGGKTIPYMPSRNDIDETLAALRNMSLLPTSETMPFWIGAKGLDPGDLIAFPNGLLEVATKRLHPVDPGFFTMAALGFDYVAKAPEPKAWLKFLREIFDGDECEEQIDTLHEIIGYLLTGDTSMEKAFALIGPPRSGKGTILNVIRSLLAASAYASPNLKSLDGLFGLQSLIGKQVAVIDDCRLAGASRPTLSRTSSRSQGAATSPSTASIKPRGTGRCR